MSEDSLSLHATCVVLGEAGLLIRGKSGAGKSSVARLMVAARQRDGGFAALVADDRVIVTRNGGRLVARAHPALAGLIEHRGLGILPAPWEPAAVLRLVVDLAPKAPPRMPVEAELEAAILGVRLPRIAAPAAEAQALADATLSWRR